MKVLAVMNVISLMGDVMERIIRVTDSNSHSTVVVYLVGSLVLTEIYVPKYSLLY